MLPEAAIGRVTIRAGARGDPAALRRTVARQLAAADLAPAAGGPAAVLVVRRLADPLPRRVSSSPSALLVDPRWEGAARDALDRHRRAAARPDRGRVDPAAVAVLFCDEAELVACVARSMALEAGSAPWWRSAVARHLTARSIPALLASEVRFLPAALARLHAWRSAEAVARCVPAAEALRLIAAMASALALPAPLTSLGASRPPAMGVQRETAGSHPAWFTQGDLASRGSAAPPPRAPPSSSPAAPPWRTWYLPPAGALAPAQEALVGVSVAAHRAPDVARSARFAEASAAWVRGASGLGPEDTPAVAHPRPAPPRVVSSLPDAARPGARGDRAQPLPAPAVWTVARPGRSQEHEASAAPPSAATPAPPAAPPPRAEVQAPGAATGDPFEPGDAAATQAARDETPPAPEAQADPLAALGEGVATGLGGVLYLLNAMEALDLPACFEPDCGLATEVGAIGTLVAVARAVLSGEATDAEDPLWALLAALDGRPPGSAPRGAGLRAEVLRLPAAWLAPLAGDAVVASLPRDPDLGPALAREGWPAPLARWASFVAPFLRHRLARALGLSGADGVAFAEALLAVPARLHATATHLDLVVPLDAVRLPVRLAGLDRSPGWLPRLGRVVQFHFR
ncbi:MAG TPA: hypothetical protein VLU43_03465 [Anaeromyxobacteraceae bacterium]|nr:hypothetical protein [Anaeromyxobacteraceae bacterium]